MFVLNVSSLLQWSDWCTDPSLFLLVFLYLSVFLRCSTWSELWSIKLNCRHLLLRSVCQQVLAWALWAAGQGQVAEVRCPVHSCQPSLPSPPVRTCSGWYSQPSSHPRLLDRVAPPGPRPWPNQLHWLIRLTCQARVILRGLDSPHRVQTLQGQQPALSVSPEPELAVHEKSLWVKMEMLVC